MDRNGAETAETMGARAWARAPTIAELRTALLEKEAMVQELTKGQRQEAKLKKEVKLLAQELQRTLADLESSKNDLQSLRQQLVDLKAQDCKQEEQQREIAHLNEEIRILQLQLEELGPEPEEVDSMRSPATNGIAHDKDSRRQPSTHIEEPTGSGDVYDAALAASIGYQRRYSAGSNHTYASERLSNPNVQLAHLLSEDALGVASRSGRGFDAAQGNDAVIVERSCTPLS